MADQTVRQQIIEAVLQILRGMKDGDTPVWNVVTREDPDQVRGISLPCVSLEEGDESVIDNTWPCLHKQLRLFAAFRFQRAAGADPYDRYNYYLGLLNAALFGDKTLGGLTIDIHEAGNSPDISGLVSETRPGGTLFIDVLYRHRNSNPYVQT